ncbi:dermonecrotic toxin domain-containing protein [Pseudomonas xantholysinigenes]|uniref:Dermonecrotic toxin N-terminal domain-containing protein n=1 Tax=Pseudomonas xantholysinigenes TaxID=2745490 RepID=A0A9E6PWF5_9PSED|nr:DUF6543 domain-containing protein [Pseudomonas xantholysinigenes]QXI38867.1 hypothetical protein HU772_001865 [Pseudomonas xantholysinigenes]
MTPLEHLEALDTRITNLQQGQPVLDTQRPARQQRQQFFSDLANFWQAKGNGGHSRRQQLARLRQAQLQAELELRLADVTLDDTDEFLLRTCLAYPLPWQRQPTGQARAEIFRPWFSTQSPNRRCNLPGTLVIIAATPGTEVIPGTTTGKALLCSLPHGIEAFASLAELHVELCERLDDPLQSQPLLGLVASAQDQATIRDADRLRYEWYADDPFDYQALALIDQQRAALNALWSTSTPPDTDRLNAALDLKPYIGSAQPLATRYALLLEKHLPDWLREASPQALAHVMQTLQELAGAISQASAPGILTLAQFQQRHDLLQWVRARLGEGLRWNPGIIVPPEEIQVSVTLARRTGPLVNPLAPSSYIPVNSRPHADDSIEMVPVTYKLEDLALLNIAWFDTDYWITARVHRDDGAPIEALTPARVKQLVRNLDAGTRYNRFLRQHLLDSEQAQWRRQAHGRINRARMHAEAAKARYAGHFLPGTMEQGYAWARALIEHPERHGRVTDRGHRIDVRQLLIQGHTVHGLLLLNGKTTVSPRVVIYAPDAPDRRPWREYRNTRELLKALRKDPALRQYVTQRMPLADPDKIDTLLRKGRLAPHVQRPVIAGHLFDEVYRAEVRSLMAQTDASTRSNRELLGRFGLDTLRILLDLLSLVLPYPAMAALALGRLTISVLDGVQAMGQDNHEEALHHAFAALSHSLDAINNVVGGLSPLPSGIKGFSGSTLMRRAFRGLPPPRPLTLPPSHAVPVEVSQLRYRIDGVHGEGVFEKTGANPGLSQYYIQDGQGRFYHVSFDGHRWRTTDPRQPDAYIKQPLKRLQDGRWVIDSPVLWHDGLPDIRQLLEDSQLHPPLAGVEVAGEADLFDAQGELYLLINGRQLPVRRHLLAGHYHLRMPEAAAGAVQAWATLRQVDGEWRIRLRQAGRSSDWLALA